MMLKGALDGITVIDFTSMMAGPFATRILTDCGANVIKVEASDGDYMRYRSPVRDRRSSYYGQMNGGKKSIAIDLKSPRGQSVARQLVAKADVVVENYRPGVMANFGLDYPSLKDECPNLIYCSISGFGQTGKRARGTKLEFGEIAERNLSNAVDNGMGERDWSAIHELARKKAGLA